LNDPNEWTNIAGDPEYADIKQQLAANIPTNTRPEITVKRQPSALEKSGSVATTGK